MIQIIVGSNQEERPFICSALVHQIISLACWLDLYLKAAELPGCDKFLFGHL